MYNALVGALQHRDQLAGRAAGSGPEAQQCQKQLQDAGFTEEATLVGRMLQRDFERNGVHLDSNKQQQLADLNMRMHNAGTAHGVSPLQYLVRGVHDYPTLPEHENVLQGAHH